MALTRVFAISLAAIVVASAAAAAPANDDDDFYKPVPKYIWGGNGGKQYDAPTDACQAGLKDLNGKYTFSTVKPTKDDVVKICVFLDAKNETFEREIKKLIVCHNGTEANQEHAGTLMCRYTKADCAQYPPKAPPKDTTARCTQEKNPTKDTIDKAHERAADAFASAPRRWIECYDAAKDEIQQQQYDKKKAGKDGDKLQTDGFPAFDPSDLYPDGVNTANIGLLCGSNAGDIAAANNAAGYPETPVRYEGEGKDRKEINYTWHHHEDLGQMELVRRDSHRVQHSGGRAIWEKAFKVKYQ